MKLQNIQLKRRRSGFTLIELLLVLVILGVLAGIVVPRLGGTTERARNTAAESQISTFGTALDAYEVDMGNYPKGKTGLQDLITAPRNAGKNWHGPYLKAEELPKDPWGNDYQYRSPGEHGEYDLFTLGADNQEGGEGINADVGNWNLQ